MERCKSQFQVFFDAEKEKIVTEVKQEAHGRKEDSYVFQLKAHLPEQIAEKWPTIRSIIALEQHRSEGRKTTIDTSYSVRSMSPRHKRLVHYIRQHWQIESSQHFVLDVVLKEMINASRLKVR